VNLTHRETEALDALCDTFVPSLAFEKDEDPALFSMSAADLGVSGRVMQALDMIEAAKRDSFRFFLRLLGNPLFMASVSRSASRFSQLSQAQRERVKQYSERAPLLDELRDRDHKRLQAQLLAMLRAKEAKKRLPDFVEHFDRGREPPYDAAIEAAMARKT